MRGRAVGFFAAIPLLLTAVATAGVGVWTTNGPPTGAFGSPNIIADSMHPGTIYAGDPTFGDSGSFKTTDDGVTWISLGTGDSSKPLATAPPDTVYFSTNHCGEAVCSGIIYISPDGGATLSNFYGQPANFLAYLMVVDPQTATTLFLAQTYAPLNSGPISGSLFRTANGGATWSEIDSGLNLGQAVISTLIGASVSGTLYLATIPGNLNPNATHGLFKTADAGATWTPLANAPDEIAALAADPANPSTIYAGTAAGVFKSLDGGATFAAMNSGLTNLSITSFAINPAQPANVFVGTAGGGVFRSADGGSTWQPMNAGLPYLYVSTLAIDGDGSHLHAGTGTGVFDYQFPQSSCAADTRTLCLNNGRFSVTADFQTEGTSSPATAVPLTSDTGYFWFFDPANVEIVTKVLNGCATNGHYWFFAGGLTNVGVQIKVKDTFTGSEPDYSNPVGTAFAPIQDTAAFSTCP